MFDSSKHGLWPVPLKRKGEDGKEQVCENSCYSRCELPKLSRLLEF